MIKMAKPRIVDEVIKKASCTACGACAAVCPSGAIKVNRNTAVVTKNCTECGSCDEVCPVFIEHEGGFGSYKGIYAAQQANYEQCQDGGTTTAILEYLFREGNVDCVVGIGENENFEAEAKIVTSEEEISLLRKVNYTYAPLMPKVKEATEKYDNIAVVGVGCQITAARNLQTKIENFDKIKYLIGIICTKSFRHNNYFKFLEDNNVIINDITKFNVTRGKFTAWKDKEVVFSTPIKNLVPFARKGCEVCSDIVAYKSDITVGSVGSAVNYNTVIIRSDIGQQIWSGIESELNIIEPEQDRLEKLIGYKGKEASTNKKLREEKYASKISN